jgi:hypothetical protein
MTMTRQDFERLKNTRADLQKYLRPETAEQRFKDLIGEEKYQEFLKELQVGAESTLPKYEKTPTDVSVYGSPSLVALKEEQHKKALAEQARAEKEYQKALAEQARVEKEYQKAQEDLQKKQAAEANYRKAQEEKIAFTQRELDQARAKQAILVAADEKAQKKMAEAKAEEARAFKPIKEELYRSLGPIEGEKKYQERLKVLGTKDPISTYTIQNPKGELIVDVGDQYDPETGVRIPPEQVNLLNAQEVARRLANKPYEPNPFNKSAPLSDLEHGGYTVLNQLVQDGLNPEPPRKVRPSEGIGREAFERYANPDYKFERARTLKDRMIQTVRENALKRLHDSFGDMDRMFAANRIGWNGRENILKAKMYENMNRELNQLDAETEMNLLKQQEASLGNQAGLALQNDDLEHRKAIEAYRINKIEEESKKEERRKNALNAVSVGQNLRQANQEDINRKAQEFERQKGHHDTQYDTYLQRLRGASIGRPDLILPERTQRSRPDFMSTMGPGEPMRMPLAGGHPILEQTPEPSSAMKDLAALAAGAGGLYLKNKAIDKLGKEI